MTMATFTMNLDVGQPSTFKEVSFPLFHPGLHMVCSVVWKICGNTTIDPQKESLRSGEWKPPRPIEFQHWFELLDFFELSENASVLQNCERVEFSVCMSWILVANELTPPPRQCLDDDERRRSSLGCCHRKFLTERRESDNRKEWLWTGWCWHFWTPQQSVFKKLNSNEGKSWMIETKNNARFRKKKHWGWQVQWMIEPSPIEKITYKMLRKMHVMGVVSWIANNKLFCYEWEW